MLKLKGSGWVAVIVGVLFLPADALGCTVCDSDTGAAVRAGIFDGRFLGKLALTALPFPILFGLVAVMHFGLPGRKGDEDGAEKIVDSEERSQRTS
jgi:hypothetical protein